MFASIIGIALALGASAPAVPHPLPVSAVDRISAWMHASADPRITVWTNHDQNPYNRGDRVRVYVRPESDGYITVVRIDTDGRVRVLFPREPWEDNFARGGRTFEVLDRGDRAFEVDDYPGVGYVFAVSSPDPMRFDPYVLGDHWDYRTIADGRVRGDPYVTATDFASRVVGEGTYDYDIVPYYVEQHYDYPRFVCYDCHNYVSYRYWDPYRYHCSRFRLVIYDDYYYYPYRYYPRGRVVVARPRRPEARYVFKDYDGRNDYVTRVRERPSDPGRRTVERDRTSADVGGRGAVPAPVEGRRRVDSPSGQPGSQPQDRRTNPGDRPSVQPNIDRGRTGAPDRRAVDPGNDAGQPTDRRTVDPNAGGSRQPTDRRTVDSNGSQPESSDGRRTAEPNRDLRPVDQGSDSRSAEPRRPADQGDNRGAEPSRQPDQPRQAEPQRPESRPDPEPRRAEPPRQEPQRSAPPPRAEPSRPQSQPRAEPSRPQPQSSQPVLRRRKPE